MKEFKNWEEAINYSYPNHAKSEYYKLRITEESAPVPANRERTDPIQRKVCRPEGTKDVILLETTPTWLTIKVQKNGKAIKLDIPRKKRSINELLKEAFK
jgi:hypothetical protein